MATGGSLGAASLGVEVDPGRFSAGMKRVEAEFLRSMKRMDAAKAVADIEADNKELLRKAAESRAALAAVKDHKARLLLDTDDATKDTAEFQEQIRGLDKQIIELNTRMRLLNRQKLVSQQELNRLKTLDKQLGLVSRSMKEQQKHHEHLAFAERKQGVELARLRNQYVALRSEINETSRSFRFFTDRVQQLKLQQTEQELDLVRKQIRELGGDTNELDKVINRHDGTLRRWGRNLSDIRVHLGIVSLNLKQLAIVGGAAANLISGLAGAFASLISVTGAALYGGIGLATSALASFGLVGAGIIGILKPLISDFGNAKKAIDAYDDAVLKYGKNSDQAKTKMEQMERVIGTLNARQREAISSVQQLGTRWNRLTKEARPAFFQAASEGIRSLNELMPMLARESVSAFEAAARSSERWFKGLRTAEAENIIQTMMSNATAAIEPLSAALGNLVTWFGRISASFSRAFEPIARGFERWTEGLAKGVENTAALDRDVDNLLSKLRSFADFLGASVSLIHNFFAAGTDVGQSFLETITSTLQRWNEWVKSVDGRNQIADWMRSGVEVTREFFGALREVGKALIDLGQITKVAFEAIIIVLSLGAKLASAVQGLPGATAALRGYLAAWLAFRALSGIRGVLLGLSTALDTLLVGALGSGRVGVAARGVSALSAGLLTMARFLPGVGAAIALGVGLFADFGGGADDAAAAAERLAAATRAVDDAMRDLQTAAPDVISERVTQARLTEEVTAAEKRLAQAVKAHGKDSRQAVLAGRELDSLRSQLLRSTDQLAQSEKRLVQLGPARAQIEAAQADSLHKLNDALSNRAIIDLQKGDVWEGLVSSLERTGTVSADVVRQMEALGTIDVDETVEAATEAYEGLQTALEESDHLFKRSARNLVQTELGMFGTGKAAKQATNDVAGLLREFGQPIEALLLEVEDKDASRKIVKLLAQASELGKTNAVLKILASSKDADAKIRAVNKLLDGVEKPRTAKVEGDTRDAENDLNRVEGFNINDKSVTVNADTNPFWAAVGGIPNVVRSVTAVIRGVFSGPFGKGAEGIAIGAAQGISDKQIAQSLAAASKRTPRQLDRSRLINKPTLLTGEEAPRHPEFVIATNPAYRERNLSFLQQAAQALGVPIMGFAKGGKVPKRFKVGAVPEDRVAGQFSSAQSKYQNAKQRVQDLEREQRDAQKAGEPFKRGPQLADARKRLPVATANKNKWQQRYNAVKSANKDINVHQARIDHASTRMDLAQEKGDRGQFKNWRSTRKNELGKLRAALQKAAGKAGAYPEFKQQLKQRIASIQLEMRQLPKYESSAPSSLMEWLEQTKGKGKNLKGLLHREVLASESPSTADDLAAFEQTLAFLTGLNRAKMPKEVVEDLIGMIVDRREQIQALKSGVGLSLEDLLTPAEAADLDRLRRAEVLASVTPDTGDDEAARRASLPFFEALFQRLSSSGAPTDVLEQVAGEIISRREGSTGAPSLGEQFFSLNKERYNLFRNFASNFIPAPTATQFNNQPSYAGGQGASPAGGSNVTITNNFDAPPPDPHTWTKQQDYEVRAATA